MNAFRALLVLILVFLVGYTALVIAEHGMGLIPIFFGDIAEMNWPGQFNADFLCMLILSGFFLAWRHHFSPAGLVLGVFGLFGGAPLLCTYLLLQSFRVEGDVAALLLGPQRAAALRG